MTSVTGEANFCMEKTCLTVGGFSQPSVARTLIEQNTSAEVGLTQRFLWIFPRPTYSRFHTLQEVNEDFTRSIGKDTVHTWDNFCSQSLKHCGCVRVLLLHLHCVNIYAVSHLKNLWKRGKTKDPSPKLMTIKQNSEAFTKHFDLVQEELETLASVDDLLSGNHNNKSQCHLSIVFSAILQNPAKYITHVYMNFRKIVAMPSPVQ